jgi:hypothetical protein
MQGRGLVEGHNAERLQAAWPLNRFDDDPRTFIGALKPVATKACDVKQNVRHPVVGNDEAESLRNIEPFDAPAHLNEIERLVALQFRDFPADTIDGSRGYRHIE